MKKIKATQNGTVDCPKDNMMVKQNVCLNCEDFFGLRYNEFTLCKRGMKKDKLLKKSGNRKRNIS